MLTTIRGRARGVTLLELLVVLMILSIVLTAAVKTWDATLERGRAETTARKLNQLVSVIVGDPDYIVAGQRADFGFVGDFGRLPNNLRELVVSPPVSPPESSRWRGPYVRSTFNESPDGFRIDGWGDTIVYGRQAYNSNESLFVRSQGGRGYADKTRWQTVFLPYSYDALTGNDVEGRIVDVRGDPVPLGRASIVNGLQVILYRPTEGILVPWPKSGTEVATNFLFTSVPQGTHRLVAMFVDVNQIPHESTTTMADVPVYPSIGARHITMRLPIDWDDIPDIIP